MKNALMSTIITMIAVVRTSIITTKAALMNIIMSTKTLVALTDITITTIIITREVCARSCGSLALPSCCCS